MSDKSEDQLWQIKWKDQRKNSIEIQWAQGGSLAWMWRSISTTILNLVHNNWSNIGLYRFNLPCEQDADDLRREQLWNESRDLHRSKGPSQTRASEQSKPRSHWSETSAEDIVQSNASNKAHHERDKTNESRADFSKCRGFQWATRIKVLECSVRKKIRLFFQDKEGK